MYSWIFNAYHPLMPVVIFMVEGECVKIYARYWDSAGKLISDEHWAHEEPIVRPRRAVIDELRSFALRYLDDLVEAIPSISEDQNYREYRRQASSPVQPADIADSERADDVTLRNEA